MRSFKPYPNERDSVKQTRERHKKPCNFEQKIPMKILSHYPLVLPSKKIHDPQMHARTLKAVIWHQEQKLVQCSTCKQRFGQFGFFSARQRPKNGLTRFERHFLAKCPGVDGLIVLFYLILRLGTFKNYYIFISPYPSDQTHRHNVWKIKQY